MPKNFTWSQTSTLPGIEEHSIRKLDVLRKYLDVYFDTVVVDPRMDCLNITLVDGFCGGGAYSHRDGTVAGSPIVLLQAVEDAKTRLNKDREKPLRINAKFVFVDSAPDHIAVLQEQIRDAGFGDEIGGSITCITSEFEQALPQILQIIQADQRVGRSIFVLDQFGYSDVPMASVKAIFSALDRPEVILTFAIDAMLNYLREESASLELYRQFGVDDAFIAEWNRNKSDDALGRLVTQRALMTNIQQGSGAPFFTPFMLWSKSDNRWMMIAHLSRHQAARDKMLSVHWDSQNSFRHIGRGSLFTLGFDTRLIEAKDSLFNFSEFDRTALNTELLEELPREVFDRMVDDQLLVDRLLEAVGNRTAATNHDIFEVIKRLVAHKEIEVQSKDGKTKRSGSQIKVHDRLILPSQKPLFSIR